MKKYILSSVLKLNSLKLNEMKKLILILTASLFCTTNFYAQQWRTDDFTKMQYDERGFLQKIPDSKLYETNNSNLNNIGTKSPAFGVQVFPEPDFLWHYSENCNIPTQDNCSQVYYNSDNNTVITAGHIEDVLTFMEFNASTGEVNWFKEIYQTNSNHYPWLPYDMIMDNEGDIVVTGVSTHVGQSTDVMVIKFDPISQDTVWTRNFAGDFNLGVPDWGNALTKDIDNNIIVVSLIQRYYNSYPHQFCGIYKLNSDGELLWMKEVGEYFGNGLNVKTDAQGSIYVVGELIEEMGVDEASVLKLDADGNIIWKNGTSSLFNNPLWAYDLTINNSGELFVGGLSRPASSTTGKDFAVAQIDTENGEFLWVSNTVNGALDSTDVCKHLVYDEASDAIFAGGYVTNETYGSNNKLSTDLCIARFDAADGTLGWVYEFDGDPNNPFGNEWIYDVVYDPSGYIIATGETYNGVYCNTVPPPNLYTAVDWITVKLDAETADVHWISFLDDEWEDLPWYVGEQWGESVDVNPSTGDVFTGGQMLALTSNEEITSNYTVVGYSSYSVGVSENLPQTGKLIQSYPNPFNAFTTLAYSLEKDAQVKIVISDLSGRIVTNLLDEVQMAGEHTLKWDATDTRGNHVNSGIYFCTFNIGNSTSTIKLVVQR